MNENPGIESLFQRCFNLPKIQLHAHLNGCIRVQTLLQLAEKNHIDTKAIQTFQQTHSRCMSFFKIVHQSIDSTALIQRITFQMIEDYFKQNTIYLQIRTTLKTLHKGGDIDAQVTATKSQYLSAILQAIDMCQVKFPTLTTRLIVSVDRSRGIQQATQNFEILTEFKSQSQLGKKYLVGLELSGNPMVNRFSEYQHLFQKAKDQGLKVSIHTAEMGCVKEDQIQDTDDIIKFKPHRLGHCTYALPGQLQKIWEMKIPVEICPTSNYNALGAQSIKDLKHFEWLWMRGIKEGERGKGISLCCDDTGLFGTNLTSQVFDIAQNFQISCQDLCQNQLKVVEDCIFESSQQIKDRLKAEILKFKSSL